MHMILNSYIEHARNREYMSGVQRDKLRIKQTAEVFTPTPLVLEMIDKLESDDPTIFSDHTRTFLDNSCGDGQFLSEIVIRKMERGSTFTQAISTTYGVELMEDNALACRARIAGPKPSQEVLDIVNNNIVNHDGLTYHYQFGEEKKRMLF